MEILNNGIESIPIKTHIDLETSCRICLLTNSELILIFDPKNNFNGILISTMINECSPFKAIRFDDYPQQICLNCVENVKIAYSFRKNCEESHAIVSAYLNGGTEPSPTDSRTIPGLDKCTQTAENSVHPCEKCELKFFTAESLRQHRLLNHRGSKHECRICKRTFRRVGYLKGHYSMHHPELGFNENIKCHICERTFERRNSLKKHYACVHKILQLPEPINRDTFFNPNDTVKIEKDEPIEKETDKIQETDKNKNQIEDKNENQVKNKNKKQVKDKNKNQLKDKNNKKIIQKKTKRKRKVSVQSTTDSENSNDEDSLKKSNAESTEDEIPISKLKENKNVVKNEKVLLSDDDLLFENDFNINNETDSEDDKLALAEQIIGIPSSTTVNEKPLPEAIKSTANENGADPDTEVFSENTQNISQVKGLNRNLQIRTCTICLKVFRFPHHLKRHMLARHSDGKQFKCTTCTSAFTTSDYLKTHMKKCPKDRSIPRSRVKKYGCKGCEEKFSSARALNNHIKAIHPTLFKKVFTCSFCTLSFENRHECTLHTNSVHENDKEYLCTQCGQRFVRNRALEIHMRRHRGEKNHKCKFCGKGFVRAGDKDLHEKYHTGDKRFKCEICGLGFVRNYSLRVHMRIHTGEKPYHCDNCPRTFAQSNDLKTHVRRDHTGERYTCDINNCCESFLQLYLLNRHKKNAHNINASSHIQRVTKVYDILKSNENVTLLGD